MIVESTHRLLRIKDCPVCRTRFSGRLNKVYCSADCKTLHNNDLARERRLEEKRIAGGLVGNYNILATLLDDAGHDSVSVDGNVLVAFGFDRNAPSCRAVIKDKPCYLYGEIALSVNEDNNTVTIFKT
jgi:hypothetical protein